MDVKLLRRIARTNRRARGALREFGDFGAPLSVEYQGSVAAPAPYTLSIPEFDTGTAQPPAPVMSTGQTIFGTSKPTVPPWVSVDKVVHAYVNFLGTHVDEFLKVAARPAEAVLNEDVVKHWVSLNFPNVLVMGDWHRANVMASNLMRGAMVAHEEREARLAKMKGAALVQQLAPAAVPTALLSPVRETAPAVPPASPRVIGLAQPQDVQEVPVSVSARFSPSVTDEVEHAPMPPPQESSLGMLAAGVAGVGVLGLVLLGRGKSAGKQLSGISRRPRYK